MVSKKVYDATNRSRHFQQQQHQQQQQQLTNCNNGKASKFKRSSFLGEDDGALSAIFLLACIACFPASSSK
ncbi:hypothetical protein C5167_050033 [Papaver somniferum]|uniref:Uncharacterized protein n=1 Tax=Papaver somniferum TaxID=3469 RepID=A0A4Y7KQX1_PAPSO|nr:hypothetical protein C5167_050033 [Papaver somniferum]